jgi:hypothetical protein
MLSESRGATKNSSFIANQLEGRDAVSSHQLLTTPV